MEKLFNDALDLLQRLIATPSFSREEDQTASLLCKFIGERKIAHARAGNNVWALNRFFDEKKPDSRMGDLIA